MKSTLLKHKLLTVLLLALWSAAPVSAQNNDIYTGELKDVGEQFREVHNQIHEIQLKAGETDAVKKAQDQFANVMNQEMLKADSSIEEDLNKSNALLKKIRNHPQINDPRAREQNLELKKMLLDYRFLERKLTPARKEAAEAEACKKALKNLEEVTMAEMKKINPDIQKLMDRKDALAAKYRELRKQVN